ncbi:MAG: hypothetical protein WC784_06700 [Candidatus Shapirobacteria bacterium]
MKKSFLFWFQIVMAWFYAVPQIYGILSGRTQGLTLILYVNFLIYVTLNLFLALAAYKKDRDVIRKYIVVVFSQWIIFLILILFLGLGKIIWRESDTIISVVIFGLSVLTVIKFKGINDPFSKGWLAVWFKSVPQLWLAYTIYSAGGGSGLPVITLIAGHLTAIPRLGNVVWAGYRGGWDKPTKGLLLGESMNVLTWSVVTIVWLIY